MFFLSVPSRVSDAIAHIYSLFSLPPLFTSAYVINIIIFMLIMLHVGSQQYPVHVQYHDKLTKQHLLSGLLGRFGHFCQWKGFGNVVRRQECWHQQRLCCERTLSDAEMAKINVYKRICCFPVVWTSAFVALSRLSQVVNNSFKNHRWNAAHDGFILFLCGCTYVDQTTFRISVKYSSYGTVLEFYTLKKVSVCSIRWLTA